MNLLLELIFKLETKVMSIQEILNEDWSDYDKEKKNEKEGKFISFEEGWEREYLQKKLRKYYPTALEWEINRAVAFSKNAVPAPYPRIEFMECIHSILLLEKTNAYQ